MKRCVKCGETKPVDAFHRWSKRDGRQPWCRDCRKAYDAAYFQRVKDRRRVEKRRKYRATLEWLWAIKESSPCTDCGQYFHHAAMSFDHLPGCHKRGDIGTLVRHAGRKTLLEEMAKCELVCANCHALRTFARGRGVAQSDLDRGGGVRTRDPLTPKASALPG